MNKRLAVLLSITALTVTALTGCAGLSKPNAVPEDEHVMVGGDVRKPIARPVDANPFSVTSPPSQRSIYFDFDENSVTKQYQGIVQAHFRYLKANPTRGVRLEGNTDERGSREYNLALGNRRVESVKRALMQLGVPEARIDTVSFGEERPRALGKDESAWAENRRVDFAYPR